jgi:hypothetical protein
MFKHTKMSSLPEFTILPDHALDPYEERVEFSDIPRDVPIQLTIRLEFGYSHHSLKWDFSAYTNIDTIRFDRIRFHLDDRFPSTVNNMVFRFSTITTNLVDYFTVNYKLTVHASTFDDGCKFAFRYVKIYEYQDLSDLTFMPYATRYGMGWHMGLSQFEKILAEYKYLVAISVEVKSSQMKRFLSIYDQTKRLSPLQGTPWFMFPEFAYPFDGIMKLGHRHLYLLDVKAVERKLEEKGIPKDITRSVIGPFLLDKRYNLNMQKVRNTRSGDWPSMKLDEFLEWVNDYTHPIGEL